MSDRNTQKYDNTLILLYQFPNLTPSSLIETIICAAMAPLHQSKAKQSKAIRTTSHNIHTLHPEAQRQSPRRRNERRKPNNHNRTSPDTTA
jgi:hypothetical protein